RNRRLDEREKFRNKKSPKGFKSFGDFLCVQSVRQFALKLPKSEGFLYISNPLQQPTSRPDFRTAARRKLKGIWLHSRFAHRLAQLSHRLAKLHSRLAKLAYGLAKLHSRLAKLHSRLAKRLSKLDYGLAKLAYGLAKLHSRLAKLHSRLAKLAYG